MRRLWWLIVLAACGGPRPGPVGSGHGGPSGAAPRSNAVTSAEPGELGRSGDDVTLTLTGLTSVSAPACRDGAAFAMNDGDTWVDVAQRAPDPQYWLDGERYQAGASDPFAPCCRRLPDAEIVVLTAPLTGVRRTGVRDGLPAYATVDLRGDVRVTFSYSLDGCETFRTFTGTIHR